MEMTKAALVAVCKEHDLYRTAELNDKLYCNFKGFRSIGPALGDYRNLKALFLEANALESLKGMPSLPSLRCLFVQQNLLTGLEGLDALPNLDTLNISNNLISKLTNLSTTSSLSTLLAEGNQLKSKEDIEHLAECPTLQTLDLQNNKIDDLEILEVLVQLPELRCLYLKGNEVVRKIRDYRRVVVSKLKKLTYLDDRPVFENERRMTDAWSVGGVEAERIEREVIREEERERDRRDFEHLQEIRKEGWRKRRETSGLPPGDTDPYFDLMFGDSSDVSDEPDKLVDAKARLKETHQSGREEDGMIYLESVRENERTLVAEQKAERDSRAAGNLSDENS